MPPTITEKHLPIPLGELTAALKGFDAGSLPEKQALIQRLIGRSPTLSLNWGGTWRYRRARKLLPGQVPRTVDELIWRKGVPAALGRANPAGFQVLYLADRPDTAFRELRIADDPVVLAEFQFLPGRAIRLALVGELAQIQRTGRGYLAGDASPQLSDCINACDWEEAQSLLITDAFLLECLTNRQDDYEISSCVAKTIFDKLPEVSGVAFPSVRQPGAINLAVRVERFWDDWSVSAIRRGRAIHLAQGYYKFTDIKHVNGIMTSGLLVWDADFGPDNSVSSLGPLWTPRAAG